jgi:hypothetical protein
MQNIRNFALTVAAIAAFSLSAAHAEEPFSLSDIEIAGPIIVFPPNVLQCLESIGVYDSANRALELCIYGCKGRDPKNPTIPVPGEPSARECVKGQCKALATSCISRYYEMRAACYTHAAQLSEKGSNELDPNQPCGIPDTWQWD